MISRSPQLVRLPVVLTGRADENEKEEDFLQVGDLARESGKTVRAVHLYEELGLLRPRSRSKGGYRLYGPDALLRIRWIQKLQEMGFSLTDIKTVVQDWQESSSAPRAMTKMRAVYTKKLEETVAHLRSLEQLRHELEQSLEYLDTCDVCEPDRLLSTCNACDHHDCAPTDVPALVSGFRAQSRTSSAPQHSKAPKRSAR